LNYAAETGMLATDACPNVTSEVFAEGSEPTEYCTAHPGHPLRTPSDASPARPAESHEPGQARAHELQRLN
jgi:hypothetical protein